MAINIAYHGGSLASFNGGPGINNAPAAGRPTTVQNVADGAASTALTDPEWVRIAASTDSLVAIGPSVTNGDGGELFPAGLVEFRWLKAGNKIGVSAP